MSDAEKLAFLKAKLEWYVDYHDDEHIDASYEEDTGAEIRWTRNFIEGWLKEIER